MVNIQGSNSSSLWIEDFVKRSITYGAISLLATRYIAPIPTHQTLMLAVINSALVTGCQKIAKVDQRSYSPHLEVSLEGSLKRMAVTVTSLALTAFTFTYGNVMKRLNLDISHISLRQMAFAYGLGEVCKETLPVLWKSIAGDLVEPIPPIENCSDEVKQAVENTPAFSSYGFAANPSSRLTDLTIRPANLFFEALGLKTTMPGTGTLFRFIESPETVIKSLQSRKNDEVIHITAQGKKGRHAKKGKVSLETYFGSETCSLSLKEVKDLLESQKIYVSPLLPKTFYLALKVAMDQDKMVILPGKDRTPQVLGGFKTGQVGKLLDEVRKDPKAYGFIDNGTMLSFEDLFGLTFYQVGSMIVKTEDYLCLVGDGYKIVSRKVGDQDQIHLINACGIRGFHHSTNVPDNEKHAVDKQIMKETFKMSMRSIGEGGYFVLPAIGLGVWGGSPEIYWGAFFEAVIECDVQLENILVSPGHQKISGTNYQGQEFATMLEEYKKKSPDNKNLSKIVNLYHRKTDVLLLAKHLKAQFPKKVVGLLNASDPDVTLGYHVGEYVNNLSHPSTTEENYAAAGTSCLNFEHHTKVLSDDSRVIASV